MIALKGLQAVFVKNLFVFVTESIQVTAATFILKNLSRLFKENFELHIVLGSTVLKEF